MQHLTWFKNPHEPTPSGPAARELLLHPADTLKYRQKDVFFFPFRFSRSCSCARAGDLLAPKWRLWLNRHKLTSRRDARQLLGAQGRVS